MSAAALSILMFLTVIDVGGRAIFNKPLIGTHEISSSLLVVMVFLGLAYVQAQKRNIAIDFFLVRLSKKTQARMDLFSLFLCLAITILMVWTGGQQAYKSWVVGTVQAGSLHYITWPFRALVPLGCGLLSLRLFIQFMRQFALLRGAKAMLADDSTR
ncbi:TRAP transporter small permease subunit [Chloroflexota bacterium]